jgi:hypothetical protein
MPVRAVQLRSKHALDRQPVLMEEPLQARGVHLHHGDLKTTARVVDIRMVASPGEDADAARDHEEAALTGPAGNLNDGRPPCAHTDKCGVP